MSLPVQWFVTFGLGLGAAAVRVLFTRRTAEGRASSAAIYHTIISASAAFGTLLYVAHAQLVLPLLVGCWLGTYVSVRLDARTT